ncbi:MAG: sirohydrochlorin cobaltochelatase [Oscillospiraceae bacterium]|nr:sirohydrochlorin cobaltochelatase [Oscillospiraceae bacterium]
MQKKGVLVVSFGTSHEDTRQKTIGAVEQAIRAENPDAQVASAYTSGIIRRIWGKRGETVFSPEEALEQLLAVGVRDLTVQPTHLICGEEFDRLREAVKGFGGRVESLRLGMPLLSSTEDLKETAAALFAQFPPTTGRLVLLMGHGTAHYANAMYAAFEHLCHNQGREDLFVGTVEGYPALEDVLPALRRTSCRAILLAPMMLVAGDHACNDMAGDGPDSWKSILTREGFSVECCLNGLGELESIRQIYLRHLHEANEIG